MVFTVRVLVGRGAQTGVGMGTFSPFIPALSFDSIFTTYHLLLLFLH